MTIAISIHVKDINFQLLTSLSMNLATEVICLMTIRGANSDNLATNVDTDFGPLVSLLLNSLLLNSLSRH
jgi:hypothetical protein